MKSGMICRGRCTCPDVCRQRRRQRGYDAKKTQQKTRGNTKTLSDTAGTISQDSESFIDFNLF
jgi:hypothetical protein